MAGTWVRAAGVVSGGLAVVLGTAPLAEAGFPERTGARTGAAAGADAGAATSAGSAGSAGGMAQRAADRGALVMVLDSSGSMADDTGSGTSRMAAAREAVGSVVDNLPDGYPTGLRVYGADKARGCTDTRLAEPVRPLDRRGIKDAVAKVKPKGDTPIGHSLRKAAEDLPDAPRGSLGQRTVLLVSDGEDTCGEPPPCEVAEELAEKGVNLRVDAIGFQVRGKARKQLECVADAGNGHYYDAPDSDALARQLKRASRLSVDRYRFRGKKITGGSSPRDAVPLRPEDKQWVDTVKPGQTRWYSVEMDARSTHVLSAAGIPQPGSDQRRSRGLRTALYGPGDDGEGLACRSDSGYFRAEDGGMPVVSSISRTPRLDASYGTCDKGAGRYLIAVERRDSASGGDAARWPLELRHDVEAPPKDTGRLAPAAEDLGAAGEDAELPSGTPRRAKGGTGFNDAGRIGKGVWRDTVVPGQTRWYRVPVGWGQQLRYDVEFSNEPTLDRSVKRYARVRTSTYTPKREEIRTVGLHDTGLYRGTPESVSDGMVPVSFTNRWTHKSAVQPVHSAGEHYIAVSLSADAADMVEGTGIGITLRADVKGQARKGPERDAAKAAPSPAAEDEADAAAGGDGGGWSSTTVAAVAGGTGVALLAGLGAWYALARRRV